MSSKMPFTLAILLGAVMTLAGSWVVAAAEGDKTTPERHGSVIGLRAEKLDEYKRLHASAWPEVTKAIQDANIRNYSIYLRKLPDGNYYLFSYFEYVGHDFAGDMKRMAANPHVKRWWKLTDPCQKPLADRQSGQWWASMDEVFHQD